MGQLCLDKRIMNKSGNKSQTNKQMNVCWGKKQKLKNEQPTKNPLKRKGNKQKQANVLHGIVRYSCCFLLQKIC